MRVQLLSEVSHAKQLVLRMIAIAFLLASLMIGTAWPMSASGQVPPAVLPVAGMGATSPLAMRSTRPAGVPLGATEITPPGVSPLVPSANMGMTACDGSSGGSSSTFLFDGGGLSRNATLSCADSQLLSSPLPPTSSAGRVGIPLGATELGTPGLSVSAPVPGPNASSATNPAGAP